LKHEDKPIFGIGIHSYVLHTSKLSKYAEIYF
jgi:exoribonuclease II